MLKQTKLYGAIFLCFLVLSGIGLLGMPAVSPADEDEDMEPDPKLMVLEYISLRARERLKTDIPLTPGVRLSPYRGIPQDRIGIQPGTPLSSENRPGNRIVALFRGAGKERVLIGIIKVRYYPTRDGRWEPRYQLHHEPVIVRDGGRWRPVGSMAGDAGGITLTNNTLPNAEGYFASLEFSVGIGTTYVDSWQVR